MWRWTLNWGRVREDLVIGSCPMRPEDIDVLHGATGVTAVMSVQHDECRAQFGIDLARHRRHAERLGLAFAASPMRDFDVEDQRRRLPDAVRCLAALLAARHTVYLHCTAGINRAPLTALGYLTFVEGLAPDAAFAQLRAGRPEAEPYWDAWRACRNDLMERNRERVALVAWHASREDSRRSAEENWYRAETALVREAVLGADRTRTD